MKTAIALLASIFAASAASAAAPRAASPRAQLNEAVAQLQKSPDDSALREKIIALAKKVKPAPARPEEADRRMARGLAAFKDAKSVADYADAAKEFEQAALAAPWDGDIYFNLGTAQDKAGSYAEAVKSLQLAALASRDPKPVKSLMYEVEYRRDKAAEAERKAREFDLSGVYRYERGTHWVGKPGLDYYDAYHYRVDIQDGKATVWKTVDIPDLPGDERKIGVPGKLYEGTVAGRELVLKQWADDPNTTYVRVSADCDTLEFYKITQPDGSEMNNGNYSKMKLVRVSR